jgi:Cysteine-rich secretory protein family
MKQTLLLSLGLALGFCGSAMAQVAPAAPAAMISSFRAQHGEGKVTLDAALNRIAEAQAAAMASKDLLDHEALAPFGSRVASAGADHAAENIAYGYDNFAKTLVQWIESPEHRKNLLMHGASRVGVAHAQSEKTHRTYWAMEIAGGYERHRPMPMVVARAASPRTKLKPSSASACHIKLLGLCL